MLRNIGSNWVRNVVTAAFGFVTTPYILHKVGDSANAWEVISSWTGVLMLLALGIPMASSKIFATAIADEDGDDLNDAVSASAALYLVVAAMALVVGAILYFCFDAAYVQPVVTQNWPELVEDVRLAFALVVVFIALNFLAQLPIGILTGHQDFVTANVISTVGVLAKLGLIVGTLLVWPSVVVLALVTVGVLLGELIVGLIVVRRKYPQVRIDLRHVNRAQVKKIIGFSIWVLLLNLGIKLCFFVNGIVLGSLGEATDPYQYKTANYLMVMLIEFLVAIGAVALPKVAHLQVKGDMEGIRALYLQWTKVAFSLTLMAGLYLMVLGPAFLHAWMGDKYQPVAGDCLVVLMMSCLLFMPVRGVSIGVLMGLGKAKAPGIVFVFMGLLNLGISLALVVPYGMLGVAYATAVPNVLFAVIVSRISCRAIGLSLTRFVTHVCVRTVIGAIPVVGVLLAMKQLDPKGMPYMVALGAAHCAVFAVVWIVFVYRNDPHIDVAGRLRSLLNRKG